MKYNQNPRTTLSDRELQVSRFVALHRVLFKRIVLGSFIAIDTFLIIFGISGFVRHGIEQESVTRALQDLSTNAIDWQSIHPFVDSKEISVEFIDSLTVGTKTDFIARINNSNTNRFVLSMEYRFIWEEGSSDWFTTSMLSHNTKHVLALAQDVVTPERIQLEINNVKWIKRSSDEPINYEEIFNNIEISDIEYRRDEVVNIGTVGSSVVFTVKNRSPFGYRMSSFNVLIQSHDVYTAASRVITFDLQAFEERTLEARFLRPLTGVRNINVEKDINIFDEENILL